LADDPKRVVVVSDHVQDPDEHERNRLGEVQRRLGLLQDLLRLTQIGREVGGGTFRSALQQGAGVGLHDQVVVDVDDPCIGGDSLGDLVDVALGRYASADVQELTDARLGGQIANRSAQEGPVGPNVGTSRVDAAFVELAEHLLRHLPVDDEVGRPAQ
jgi:hypothetical protein